MLTHSYSVTGVPVHTYYIVQRDHSVMSSAVHMLIASHLPAILWKMHICLILHIIMFALDIYTKITQLCQA